MNRFVYLTARITAAVAVVVLTGCSETPNASTTEAKSQEAAAPAQPIPGQTAFWEAYKLAHKWAPDQVPLSLKSGTVPGFKNADGKAAQWVAIFGSPSLRQAETFTYSIAAVPPDISKGAVVGHAIPWAGPRRDALTFATSDFKVDSDAAFKTASADAKAWLAKHPDQEWSMSLGNASRFSGPVWSIQWGTEKNGYLAFVNAATGELEKPKK
jgi:hypothetical protein